MPHKILIVEDNENNRSLFRDILTFHGHQVSVASDGQEGVALARQLMPDGDQLLAETELVGFFDAALPDRPQK